MKIFHYLLLTIMCASLASCQSPTAYTPKLTQEEIQAEEAHQQTMVNKIKANGGLPKLWSNRKNMRKQFENVGKRIEKAGAEICRELHLQRNGCYYYFKLARNEKISSSADGENITIYTGMMRFVQNDDELAVVMGHEFSHNLMNHISAQKRNATFGMILGMTADAIATSQGINMYGEITKSVKDIATLTYSVDFEKEADYIGLYVLARAGYNIQNAPKLWRRMSIEDPTGIYSSVTHPSNAARFVALQKAVTEITYKRKHNIPLLPDFKNTRE